MKSVATSAIVSIAVLSSCSLAVVTMNIAKDPAALKASRRSLMPQKGFTASLENTGSDYLISVQVGTPPQDLSMVVDTGSSDVWVLATTSNLCTDPTTQEADQMTCQIACNY